MSVAELGIPSIFFRQRPKTTYRGKKAGVRGKLFDVSKSNSYYSKENRKRKLLGDRSYKKRLMLPKSGKKSV